MWQRWQQGGRRPEDLKPLLDSIRPLIHSQANIYAQHLRDVPPAAVRAEFLNQAVKGLETYDPNYGTKISTHLRNHLDKAKRFITSYQNPARIPETRVYKIGQFQRAETELDERLGRPPTQHELADHLKWSPRQVGMMQREVRKAYATGQSEMDPVGFTPSRQQEVLRLLPYDLTPDEKQVFEYLYGVGGKPKLGPGDIAQRLGMSAPKVSRLKSAIAQKYTKYTR